MLFILDKTSLVSARPWRSLMEAERLEVWRTACALVWNALMDVEKFIQEVLARFAQYERSDDKSESKKSDSLPL